MTVTKSALTTIELPPNLRQFLEAGGDPRTFVPAECVRELGRIAATSCYATNDERLHEVAMDREWACDWAADPEHHHLVAMIAWSADACEDPDVYELLQKHLTEAQVSDQLDVMDAAYEGAWQGRVALRLERIDAVLGLAPLPKDTPSHVYDIRPRAIDSPAHITHPSRIVAPCASRTRVRRLPPWRNG